MQRTCTHIQMLLEIKQVRTSAWKICTKIESWSAPWRYQKTWMISVVVCKVLGQITSRILGRRLWDLWSIHLSRLEHVGGWSRTTIDYHEHHGLPLPLVHVQSVANHTYPKLPIYSEHDNVMHIRYTRSIFRGPGNWSDPSGTAMPSCGKLLKTIENHGKACLAPYVVGFAAVVNYVQIEELSVQHVQACPCQNY